MRPDPFDITLVVHNPELYLSNPQRFLWPKIRYYTYTYKYVGVVWELREVIELWTKFIHLRFSVQGKLDWHNNFIMDINESYLRLNSKLKRNGIMS